MRALKNPYLWAFLVALVISTTVVIDAAQRIFDEEYAEQRAWDESGMRWEEFQKIETPLEQVLLICGHRAGEVARMYPRAAEEVYGTLGCHEDLEALTRDYGNRVVPIIAWVARQEDDIFNFQMGAGEIASAAWEMFKLAVRSLDKKNAPSREDFEQVRDNLNEFFELREGDAEVAYLRRMLTALVLLKKNPSLVHRMVLVEDQNEENSVVVKRLFFKTVLHMGINFFTSGIQNVEEKMSREQELTLVDGLGVALDAIIIGYTVKGVVTAAKGSLLIKKAAVVHTGRSALLGKFKGLVVLTKPLVKPGIKVLLIGGTGYVIVTHPRLVMTGLYEIAETFGWWGVLTLIMILWVVLSTSFFLPVFLWRKLKLTAKILSGTARIGIWAGKKSYHLARG